ncbi:hypothetical protein [Aestuariivivens sediminicola]|uniref:hypothetical protein n=1 Tax=Aestuariivivens sediminicola TaxID=2913560 RepID=UPI001F591EAE|nr:hypothetical protein [Aestuariivivens sediminicola]
MLRYLKIGGIAVLSIGVLWYVFFKPYDYRITFKTTQASGIIYQSLMGWNNWQTVNKDVVKTFDKIPFSELQQELNLNDSVFDIRWKINRISDSVCQVHAYWSDRKNGLMQRLMVPFVKTDFVKRSLKTVKRIQRDLNDLHERYYSGHIEFAKIPEQFCAYISLESKIEEKANQMMANNSYILGYLQDNNIEIVGPPFLEVTQWNEKEGYLKFNFCFPVDNNRTYKEYEDIKFKKTDEKSALRIKFNGNYRISDCAWFNLIDYAERNHIDIHKLPTEIFYNDPHNGGDELEWEAEIYMPIQTHYL